MLFGPCRPCVGRAAVWQLQNITEPQAGPQPASCRWSHGLKTTEPIYSPQNMNPAYQLNWGLTIFWREHPIPEPDWLTQLQSATEPDGVRVLKHRTTTRDASQFFVSTKPQVAGAQPMLHIRAIRQSPDRNDFYAVRIQTELQSLYVHKSLIRNYNPCPAKPCGMPATPSASSLSQCELSRTLNRFPRGATGMRCDSSCRGSILCESSRVFQNCRRTGRRRNSVELFHPTVSITSSAAATVDATPTIFWTAAPGAASYEVVVTKPGSSLPIYDRTGIVGLSHRIDVPLAISVSQIQVRAIFPDGSRSSLSKVQSLQIGIGTAVKYANGIVSWNAANQATNYELWINYLGVPNQRKIVYQPLYIATSYRLPSTLPKGRYQSWLRPVRAESGQLYFGAWTNVICDVV